MTSSTPVSFGATREAWFGQWQRGVPKGQHRRMACTKSEKMRWGGRATQLLNTNVVALARVATMKSMSYQIISPVYIGKK